MVKLNCLLVALRMLAFSFGRLLSDENCHKGLSYNGFCLSVCPSGFTEFNNSCRPEPGSFFEFDCSNALDKQNLLNQSSTEFTPSKFPTITSTRGLFFKNYSKIPLKGSLIFSNKMTASIFILLLEIGEIISGSKESLFFNLEKIIELEHYKNEVLGKWNLFHLQMELFNSNTINFELKFGEIKITGPKIIPELPDFDDFTWILGDFTGIGLGFVGFLYKAQFFNYFNEPGEIPLLEDCEIEYLAWEKCYSGECLDSMCWVPHKRILISCFDPDCTTCSSEAIGFCIQCNGYLADGFCFTSCPLMFTTNSAVCNNDNLVLKVNLESSSGITVNPNKFTILKLGSTAIYIPLRGYIFQPSSNYKSGTSFYMFQFYSIQVWINVISGNTFSITFGEAGLKVESSELYNHLSGEFVPYSIQAGWNFYQISLYSEKFVNKTDYIDLQSYYPYSLKITKDDTISKINTIVLSQADGDLFNIKSNSNLNFFNIITDSLTTILMIDIRYAAFYNTFSTEVLNSVCSSSVSCSFCSNSGIKYFVNCLNGNSGCYNCYTSSSCTVSQTNYCYNLLDYCYNPCPYYYSMSYFKCVLEPIHTMVFILNTLNGTVPDSFGYKLALETTSKNAYPSINYNTDPIPTKNRGFYLGKTQSTTLQTSIKIIFSPQFFLGIWVNPSQYSGIAKKLNVLYLNITQAGIGVALTKKTNEVYRIVGANPITLNQWVFIGISLKYVYGIGNNPNNTNIDMYVNALKETYTVSENIFIDSSNNLFIGTGASSYLVGWVYKVIYSAIYWTQTEIDSEIGSCSGCSCPKSLNYCLLTCSHNEYYALDQCRKCDPNTVCKSVGITSLCFDKDSCTVCDNFYTCKQCSISTCKTTCSSLCKTCSSPSIMNCETCADSYHAYNDICIPYCPDLSTSVGSNCVLDSTSSLSYNFHTNSNNVSDSLDKLTFQSNFKLFCPNRGWYTSLVSTQNSLILTPYPSLFIWIKLTDYGEIINKVDSSGGIEFKFILKSDNTLEIIQQTSLGLITNSNIVVSGIRPFSWKYFAFICESNSVLSKSYLYVDLELVKTFELGEQYIISSPDTYLQLGNNSPIFLYSFSYFANLTNAYFSTSFNTGTNCIYPKEFTNCLWDCPITHFFDGVICKPCFLASSCAGPLYIDFITCYTYLNNYCTDICPTLTANISSICTLDPQHDLDFQFDTISGTIPSTNSLFSFTNPGSTNYPNFLETDPKANYKRGYYFYNSWVQTTENLVFSNQFTLEFWVNFYSLSTLVSKSNIEISLGVSAIVIKLSLLENTIFYFSQDASIFLYGWNYLSVVLTPDRKVQIYLKNNLISNLNTNGYFLDTVEPFKLGGQLTNSFKGWIYRFKYSATALQSSQLLINTETTPSLWDCLFGYYFDSNSCISCKNQCNCRRSIDCTLCLPENCQVCSSYSSICTQCFEDYELFPDIDKCKICSNRCLDCKHFLDECLNCRSGFVNNFDGTCMVYCSNGDFLQNGLCVNNEVNIMNFVLNKAVLPFESNGFVLELGTLSKSWPNDDLIDPKAVYQRGFYFNWSLLRVNYDESPGYLQLSNKQTFEIYLFSMEGVGSVLSFYKDNDRVVSLIISGNTIKITYQVTNSFENTVLSLEIPFDLNTWTRLTWILQVSDHQIHLQVYKGSTLIGSSSALNSVFSQQLDSVLQLGSFKKLDYFIGYLYSFSIYNFVRIPENDFQGCTCPYCTVSGHCLINCGPLDYIDETCKSCPKNCINGCGQGLTCSIFKDPLCESFNFLEEPCLACVYGAKGEKRPCECVKGGVFNPSTNKCECKNGEFVYQDSCDPCYRYLKSNEVSSYFLTNFIELFFDFTIKIAEVNCTDLFPDTVLEKFGQGFTCKYGNNFKTLTITMGSGFSLLNERISLNLMNLKGYERECGNPYQEFYVQIYYLEDPPKPTAIINTINPININCEDLNIDGSLSTGQYFTGLLYKWEFISSISVLNSYSNDFTSNSYVQVDRLKLKSEVIVVKLTVLNRFNLQSSETLTLKLTDQDSLMVEFDSSIDYSCEVSKTCQFFIQNKRTCIENPIFIYTWNLNDIDLLLSRIQSLNFGVVN